MDLIMGMSLTFPVTKILSFSYMDPIIPIVSMILVMKMIDLIIRMKGLDATSLAILIMRSIVKPM